MFRIRITTVRGLMDPFSHGFMRIHVHPVRIRVRAGAESTKVCRPFRTMIRQLQLSSAQLAIDLCAAHRRNVTIKPLTYSHSFDASNAARHANQRTPATCVEMEETPMATGDRSTKCSRDPPLISVQMASRLFPGAL